MRVNMNKTKVMISEEHEKVRQKAVRWSCGVCSKVVGSNSLQCTSCQKWVHKKCSAINGSESKGMKSIGKVSLAHQNLNLRFFFQNGIST